MDIVRSLKLESFILTKLRKPSVPVNLVGPQVSLPARWVPASQGRIHFLCVRRRNFRWVRADSGGGGDVFFAKYGWPVRGVPAIRGNDFFSQNTGGPSSGSQMSGGRIIIFRVIRRYFLAAAVDPAVSLSTTVLFRWKLFLDHVDHAAPGAPGRWTTARPRKGTTRSRGRHGSGSPLGEEYEGSPVRLRCEAAVAAE